MGLRFKVGYRHANRLPHTIQATSFTTRNSTACARGLPARPHIKAVPYPALPGSVGTLKALSTGTCHPGSNGQRHTGSQGKKHGTLVNSPCRYRPIRPRRLGDTRCTGHSGQARTGGMTVAGVHEMMMRCLRSMLCLPCSTDKCVCHFVRTTRGQGQARRAASGSRASQRAKGNGLCKEGTVSCRLHRNMRHTHTLYMAD